MTAWGVGLGFVLKNEGGYVNHPADPGGATNMGVTQRTYDVWLTKQCRPLADVRTIQAAEVSEIYRTEYWVPAGCDELPAGLDVCVFDAAVNCGVKKARAWKMSVDTNGKHMNVEQQIREYIGVRRAYYRTRKHFVTFGKGWFNRCAALESLCLSLAREGLK